MKTLITSITIQVIEQTNSITVFTDYEINNIKYDGFNPYKSLDEAIAAAESKMSLNKDFVCSAKGYNILTFKANGDKNSKFISK